MFIRLISQLSFLNILARQGRNNCNDIISPHLTPSSMLIFFVPYIVIWSMLSRWHRSWQSPYIVIWSVLSRWHRSWQSCDMLIISKRVYYTYISVIFSPLDGLLSIFPSKSGMFSKVGFRRKSLKSLSKHQATYHPLLGAFMPSIF